jgi:hypothetical protein
LRGLIIFDIISDPSENSAKLFVFGFYVLSKQLGNGKNGLVFFLGKMKGDAVRLPVIEIFNIEARLSREAERQQQEQ